MRTKILTILALAVSLPFTAAAAELHVTASGSASGSGSEGSPLDLATALGSSSPARAGDTIWVHGGRYSAPHFYVYISGSAGNPIKVRPWQTDGHDERVTLYGHIDIGCFTSSTSSYVWFYGLEAYNRGTGTGVGAMDVSQTGNTNVGIKLINMIAHDSESSGIGVWQGGQNNEFYGCLSYFNGWRASDGGHGHGFYIQSANPTYIRENILFRQCGINAQLYGQSGLRDYVTFEGNVSFDGGALQKDAGNPPYGCDDLWFDGTTYSHNLKWIANMSYAADDQIQHWELIGHGINTLIQDNYFAGPTATTSGFWLKRSNTGTVMTNNTIFKHYQADDASVTGSGNVFLTAKPTSTKIFVRPNAYEAGRANLVVYNWEKTATVAVDVSSVLHAGDMWEVTDAENWFGGPIAQGVYAGGTITVPMTGLAASQPIGLSMTTPFRHTAPEFGVFVLRKVGTGSVTQTVYGDANGDGSFGMADINVMVDWILMRSSTPAAGTALFTACDVNGDGQLGMADLNLLVDRLLGRVTKFPAE
jgi:hypothetical protein